MKISEKLTKICIVSPFPPPFGGMAIQAEKLASNLEKSGFEIIKVPTNSTIQQPFSFLASTPFVRTCINLIVFLYHLDKALKEVELVYFFSGFMNFFLWITIPAIALIKFRGKKIILSARGGNARSFFKRQGIIAKPFVKRIDAVTTPSGFLRDVFIDCFKIRATVVPNFADLNQFTFRSRKKFDPKFLVTRNLEPSYDVQTIIKAFKIISEKYNDASLGIVGDGSLRQELEKLVNELKLTKNIIFYGQVKHTQIQAIYNNYDIFLNSSKVDNLPGSILEAFACGLPVISTNAGGIPYMVKDGVSGLLVEIGDSVAMAEKMRYILVNPDKGNHLVKSGLEELKIYSWKNIKQKLLPIFERVINKKN